MAKAAIVGESNALHYFWGNNCEGWKYLDRKDLSVIVEQVPPGESDSLHFHERSRQFFYVLSGTASLEIDGLLCRVRPGEGIEVAPGTVHRLLNETDQPVRFLVISMPHSHGDRILA